jgi:hypothetical protein
LVSGIRNVNVAFQVIPALGLELADEREFNLAVFGRRYLVHVFFSTGLPPQRIGW